ncbi:hypothetical protein LVJ94_48685 [Pendulispora rubella]|uniref:Uncharacterized protein n=1 Tax=Pendulispora rubella TaxID=2741070 RepID=A0ABZ2L1T1_9BACT
MCAVLVVAAQLFQHVAIWFFIPPESSPRVALEIRNMPIDRVRAVVIMFSILAMLGVYMATAFERAKRAPGAALVGFAAALLFGAFDLGYRSIDFFFVTQRWAAEYQSTQVESVKLLLIERVATWDQIVSAIYFPLILATLVANASFTLAMRTERGRFARLAFAAWIIDTVRRFVRVLGFAGIDALQPINDAIFFPSVVMIYSLLAVWLWKRGSVGGDVDRIHGR